MELASSTCKSGLINPKVYCRSLRHFNVVSFQSARRVIRTHKVERMKFLSLFALAFDPALGCGWSQVVKRYFQKRGRLVLVKDLLRSNTFSFLIVQKQIIIEINPMKGYHLCDGLKKIDFSGN